MSPYSPVQCFKRHSVPLVVFFVMAVPVMVVPPIVLGELTAKTYALTAAVLLLAVSAVTPYAVLVAVGTLPLLYAGVASFAAPQPAGKTSHPFSALAAVRHTVAGISYVLAPAVVGAIGIGAQLGMTSDSPTIPGMVQPAFLYLGGILVAGAFVSLQLWRHTTSLNGLTRRTIVWTVGLGGLVALSPAVVFWTFYGVL